MTDPRVEEIRARRAAGTRIRLVDLDYLLTKLDEAERQRYLWQGTNAETLAVNSGLRAKLEAAEERERALIAGVREMLALEPFRFADADDPERNLGDPVLWQSEVVAILSRLLPSTPTEEGKKNDE